MSKRICKKCGSVDIRTSKYSDGDKCYVCEDCCCVGLSDDFPEYTVFHKITSSPEVLAKKTVHPIVVTDLCTGNVRMCYYSPIVDQRYDSEAEALAATVARLKEVEK